MSGCITQSISSRARNESKCRCSASQSVGRDQQARLHSHGARHRGCGGRYSTDSAVVDLVLSQQPRLLGDQVVFTTGGVDLYFTKHSGLLELAQVSDHEASAIGIEVRRTDESNGRLIVRHHVCRSRITLAVVSGVVWCFCRAATAQKVEVSAFTGERVETLPPDHSIKISTYDLLQFSSTPLNLFYSSPLTELRRP